MMTVPAGYSTGLTVRLQLSWMHFQRCMRPYAFKPTEFWKLLQQRAPCRSPACPRSGCATACGRTGTRSRATPPTMTEG